MIRKMENPEDSPQHNLPGHASTSTPPSKYIFRAIPPGKKPLSLSFALTALIISILTLQNWDRTQSMLDSCRRISNGCL